MSDAMNHEELVELLQEGRIGYLRFVLEGENEQDYLEWCRAPGPGPAGAAAACFVGHPGIMQMERQLIDDVDYGIWN